MKIALILPYLKAGGTERQASYIVNHLKDKGHEVTVLSIENSKTFESLFDVPIMYLNSKNSYLRLIFNLYLLVKKIKSLNPDLIISRAWSANVITSMASYFSSKPWVLFISGSANLSEISFIKKSIHKLCIGKASKVISVSQGAKDNIINSLSLSRDNIEVIHNGVDIERIKALAEEKVKLPSNFNRDYISIVFVGRLIHRKGIDLLIKSVERIIHAGKKVNLIIVGEGDQEDVYKSLVLDLKIQQYVFFVGQKLNPFPYMEYSDIFVLPSRSEGFPNVLLEAMSIGKPVVAADCETGPNEIINGTNGILVGSDDYESIYNGLMIYLNDEIKKSKYGDKANQTVKESFNLKKQVSLIEDQILNCIR